MLTFLVDEKAIEPIVIKKAIQFVSFKFGDVQLLDILNFLAGASIGDTFLKTYKLSELKPQFPYEWFDDPKKLNYTQFLPYHTFFRKLRSIYPLEDDYSDFQFL